MTFGANTGRKDYFFFFRRKKIVMCVGFSCETPHIISHPSLERSSAVLTTTSSAEVKVLVTRDFSGKQETRLCSNAIFPSFREKEIRKIDQEL